MGEPQDDKGRLAREKAQDGGAEEYSRNPQADALASRWDAGNYRSLVIRRLDEMIDMMGGPAEGNNSVLDAIEKLNVSVDRNTKILAAMYKFMTTANEDPVGPETILAQDSD